MSKHTCRVCGLEVARKPGIGRWPTYCSDECRMKVGEKKSYSEKKTNSCFDCGTSIQSRSKRCNKCHLNNARSNRVYDSRPDTECPTCGVLFIPYRRETGYTRTCSKSCGTRLAIREGKHNLQDGKQVGRDMAKVERNWRRRRALLLEVDSEPYTRLEIIDRDEGICHLCGLPVDVTVEWPHPDYPTVDHVLPISLGGPDTLENIRLAHAHCNISKGNRVEALESR